MTTIAIDHDTIAADGRETGGGIIYNDKVKKIGVREGVLYAFAGNVGDGLKLLDLIFDGVTCDCEGLSANAITIKDGEVIMHGYNEGEYSNWPVSLPYSFGSGSQFALAAMDLGKTAKEAVKYAMTRDPYTGGKIKAIKYKQEKGYGQSSKQNCNRPRDFRCS